MKIFVAGATGVLGRRAVKLLVEAGHDVTAVTRTEAKAEQTRDLGAAPTHVDIFDPGSVTGAVNGHEVVMNLATHIPSPTKSARKAAWKENDRIRTEASRNLVDAALAAGSSRYIQESIAFMYADKGAEWIAEDVPLDLAEVARSVENAEAQAQRFTDDGRTGVVLRFGFFYGHDAAHTRTQMRAARMGISTFVGCPEDHLSAVHLDDAASAVVAALRAPPGVWNIVDDEPLTRLAMDEAVAAAVGRKRLHRPPAALVRMGGAMAETLTRPQRISNRRFKEATGWTPSYPSVREGIAAVVRQPEAKCRD